MALVSYSDSEEDIVPVAKRLKKNDHDNENKHEEDDESPPPLPASFHNLYSSTVRVSNTDDPALHAGRKRLVKHVEGNWPAHVYLEWYPEPQEHDALNRLLSVLPDSSNVTSLLQTPLGVSLPLHISLSAPLVLRTETKDTFLDTLTEILESLLRSRREIVVRPAGLSWHGNENSSRYFLVLRVEDTPGDHGSLAMLNQLLRASNRAAREYGQPALYTGESRRNEDSTAKRTRKSDEDEKRDFSSYFHISIAWALPSPDLNLKDEHFRKLPAVEKVMEEVRNMPVRFDAVKIRIGQTVTALPFSTKHSRSKGGMLG